MTAEKQTSASASIEPAPIVERDAIEHYTRDQITLIKRTVAKGATDDELRLFLEVCKRRGADPLLKEIHFVKRYDRSQGCEVANFQVSIDYLRRKAGETGGYEGQTPVEWCDENGAWCDVWLHDRPPAAARVGVHRKGFREPVQATVLWKSSVQTKKDGSYTSFWARRGPEQLAKCAEAAALRKAYPEKFGKLYIEGEIEDDPPEHVDPVRPAIQQPRNLAELSEKLEAELAEAEPTEAEAEPKPGPASGRVETVWPPAEVAKQQAKRAAEAAAKAAAKAEAEDPLNPANTEGLEGYRAWPLLWPEPWPKWCNEGVWQKGAISKWSPAEIIEGSHEGKRWNLLRKGVEWAYGQFGNEPTREALIADYCFAVMQRNHELTRMPEPTLK